MTVELRYRQKEHSFATEADDELAIVDRYGSKLVTLNRSGAVIWEQLASDRSLDELTDAMVERFPSIDRATLATDVKMFIEETTRAGIVVPVS